MAYKSNTVNSPEEFKAIEADIRWSIGEMLSRHAEISMDVVTHTSDGLPYERSPHRKPVKYVLEIKIEVDITDVPLTIKPDK